MSCHQASDWKSSHALMFQDKMQLICVSQISPCMWKWLRSNLKMDTGTFPSASLAIGKLSWWHCGLQLCHSQKVNLEVFYEIITNRSDFPNLCHSTRDTFIWNTVFIYKFYYPSLVSLSKVISGFLLLSAHVSGLISTARNQFFWSPFVLLSFSYTSCTEWLTMFYDITDYF